MESQIETVLGSRKQKTALSGERGVSDIQMGAWEQPAPAAAGLQRGGGEHRQGRQRHWCTLDSPGTGGKKGKGELGSVGILIVRYSSMWTHSTSASATQCWWACSHTGDVRSRTGTDTGHRPAHCRYHWLRAFAARLLL